MNLSDSPDRQLVAQALAPDRAGSQAAFGVLIERHRPLAARLALRMLADPAEADDVAQEACLHAYLSLGRLRDPDRFGAWLYGITVNLCRMRLRSWRDVYALEDWDGGRIVRGFTWDETQLSAEAIVEIRELHRIILSAIDVLPSEQQAVVRWHYLDGLTLSEIGVLAGAPLGTVKARLHRARERLRALLAYELDAYSSWKEEQAMIEVIVDKVLLRVPKLKEDEKVEDVLVPAPPGMPFGATMIYLRGDPQGAQAIPQPPPMPQRVVLLKEKQGERVLPIWIGPYEADLIAMQLSGHSTPRPMLPELTARLLGLAKLSVERVAVSRLHEEVFYATLWTRQDQQTHEVDARPSDAITLALRLNAPIFVAADVMAAQAVEPDALTDKLNHRLPDEEREAFVWIEQPAPAQDVKPPTEKK